MNNKEPWSYTTKTDKKTKAPQRLNNREWNEDIAHVQFEHIWERLKDEPQSGQYSFGPQQRNYDYGIEATAGTSDQDYAGVVGDNPRGNHYLQENQQNNMMETPNYASSGLIDYTKYHLFEDKKEFYSKYGVDQLE